MVNGEDPRLSEPEQAIVRALHGAAMTERAPAGLRERLATERARGRARSGLAPPARRFRVGSGAATILAAAIVAAVLLIPGSSPITPQVSAAAALATRGAAAPAPALDPTASYRLTARVGSLHFPNWEEHRGWRAVGSRTDRLGNRDVMTVYYARDGRTIAYSIVSSPALGSPGHRTFMLHGRTVVTWRERDHTCLLSGSGVPAATLRSLAQL